MYLAQNSREVGEAQPEAAGHIPTTAGKQEVGASARLAFSINAVRNGSPGNGAAHMCGRSSLLIWLEIKCLLHGHTQKLTYSQQVQSVWLKHFVLAILEPVNQK